MNQSEDKQLENLDTHLRNVWLRSQKLHLSAGLLVFLQWGLLLFAGGLLADWLIDLPTLLRVMLLLVIVGVSFYQAWMAGWGRVCAFNSERAAKQIEDHHGDFESILVTAVQFRESKLAPGTSKSLQEATCRKAEEAVADVRPEKVVGYSGLQRPVIIALVIVLSAILFSAFNGSLVSAGIARILPPWKSISYPTDTQLELSHEVMVVKEGSPAVISAMVSGEVPSSAKLELRTGKGEPRVHHLEIVDGKCDYTIKAAYRGFEYRILAGDAKSEWLEVEVVTSPRIKKARVLLKYPDYMKRAEETLDSLTMTVPEGTIIEWQLDLDKAVKKALYSPAGGEAKPLEISDDGMRVTMSQSAKESRGYSFSWEEKGHGFSFVSSNHYLQVAPDQAPRVELASPKSNLYATLGRKLDIAFRGRDDHGIGSSHVAYRVNKIEEQKVPFEVQGGSDGGLEKVAWDYRKALPDLAIGDTVSFVVELADSYPGADGPHRSRSQSRSITFLSKKDYLKQINKQKRRLLNKLRAIYREERKVHVTVSQLDPGAGEFVQACQIEAVRQDLFRERLGVLKQGIQSLMDDLAANEIKDKSITDLLVSLSAEMQRISDKQLVMAADSLRDLGALAQDKSHVSRPDLDKAVRAIDNVARELSTLVLQMGFREATEVMAREIHAIAENQAPLRSKTILLEDATTAGKENLAKHQEQLGQWVSRLFNALPEDKESSISDALVAFNLSRLVKGLRQGGVEDKMRQAGALIRESGEASLAKARLLQAEIIESILYAEFRLRIGAEHDALTKAGALLTDQVIEQKKIREACASISDEQFQQRRGEMALAQAALQKKMHLLLMPDIPSFRPTVLDRELPKRPPVEKLLSAAEGAMKQAVGFIQKGERSHAAREQKLVEESFSALVQVIHSRIEQVTERSIMSGVNGGISKHATEIIEFEERQINLLEKTEDAEEDSEALNFARLQEKLAHDFGKFKLRVVKWDKDQISPCKGIPPLLNFIEQIELAMKNATVALKGKDIDVAVEHQGTAVDALDKASKLLESQLLQNSALFITLGDTEAALMPAPFVGDIKAEQLDMVKQLEKVKPAALPKLAIVQKNLIHAVNAVLASLDPLAHQIESGTVFLFAKDDMDAAAEAIEENDIEEAVDAGSFVAETLGGLSKELDKVTPRYSYILELVDFYQQISLESGLIRMEQDKIKNLVAGAKEEEALVAFIDAQKKLEERARSYGEKLFEVTGENIYAVGSEHMAVAKSKLKAGDRSAAIQAMEMADAQLMAEGEKMILLMELLSNVLKPPLVPVVLPENKLVLEMLSLATDQKVLVRKIQAANGKLDKKFTDAQSKFTARYDSLINRSRAFVLTRIQGEAEKQLGGQAGANVPEAGGALIKHDRLVKFLETYEKHLTEAKRLAVQSVEQLDAGEAKAAVNAQHSAGAHTRYTLIAFISEFLVPPGPPGPTDPANTDPVESLTDSMNMFMPGAVRGSKPKSGRQEWEVLGKRDRAALNENFARELPLEYRAVLKDYYEKLAQ